MKQAVAVFRSDIEFFQKTLKAHALKLAVLVVIGIATSQWNANTFPEYSTYVMAVVAIVLLYVGLVFIARLLAKAFPVELLSDGIRCYDLVGRYVTVRWSDVTQARLMLTGGFPYVYIRASTTRRTLTVPTWLTEMDQFRQVLQSQLGHDHFITRAFSDAAT